MSDGEEYLDALASILDQIGELLDRGRERYDGDLMVRLALQRLWIAAGESARLYCGATGTEVGVEPWSSLWGYRNVLVHHLLDDIDDDLVWVESSRDLSEYRTTIGAIRQGR
ncbi:MAG TPA: HepT-like ribonuclease domain-containing protein [Acidimicrobiales bacterium]|nr:HepT-like ribonuclease domain-containing protein [Acidimicrobiales bacterium]